MKKRFWKTGWSLLCIFIAGCAATPAPRKAGLPPKLVGIVVTQGDTIFSADNLKLARGKTVILTAKGWDERSKPYAIAPTWVPSATGIVDVTPATGDRVNVTGRQKGVVDLLIRAEAVEARVSRVTIQ